MNIPGKPYVQQWTDCGEYHDNGRTWKPFPHHWWSTVTKIRRWNPLTTVSITRLCYFMLARAHCWSNSSVITIWIYRMEWYERMESCVVSASMPNFQQFFTWHTRWNFRTYDATLKYAGKLSSHHLIYKALTTILGIQVCHRKYRHFNHVTGK